MGTKNILKELRIFQVQKQHKPAFPDDPYRRRKLLKRGFHRCFRSSWTKSQSFRPPCRTGSGGDPVGLFPFLFRPLRGLPANKD